MLLPRDDVAQFFRLMWGLQFYVNQRRKLISGVSSGEAYAKLDSQQKVIVRDALWKNLDLIDAYVQANPDQCTDEELTIISKWKNRIAGKFYIFRYLKNHAILIENSQVYGVKGLYDSFDVVLQGRPLPVLVEMVLLPYKGQIIYDGLCLSYNVYFGAGIRGDLQEEYMVAKQNGRLQTSLETDKPLQKSHSKERDLAVGSEKLVGEIVQSSGRLRGGTVVQGATFGVLRASAKLVEAAVMQPDDAGEIERIGRQVSSALRRLEKILERAES
jgi:hypothetical protein